MDPSGAQRKHHRSPSQLNHAVKLALDDDPSWQFYTADERWICPFCLTAVRSPQPGRAALLRAVDRHVSGRCPSYHNGAGQPCSDEEIRQRQTRENIGHLAMSDRAWQVFDHDGYWYSPATLQRVDSVRIRNRQFDAGTVDRMADHLERCPSFNKGIIHPPSEVQKARDHDMRIRKLSANITRLLYHSIWRYANDDGQWVCPYCLDPVDEVIPPHEAAWPSVTDDMARHLLASCRSFGPQKQSMHKERDVALAAGQEPPSTRKVAVIPDPNPSVLDLPALATPANVRQIEVDERKLEESTKANALSTRSSMPPSSQSEEDLEPSITPPRTSIPPSSIQKAPNDSSASHALPQPTPHPVATPVRNHTLTPGPRPAQHEIELDEVELAAPSAVSPRTPTPTEPLTTANTTRSVSEEDPAQSADPVATEAIGDADDVADESQSLFTITGEQAIIGSILDELSEDSDELSGLSSGSTTKTQAINLGDRQPAPGDAASWSLTDGPGSADAGTSAAEPLSNEADATGDNGAEHSGASDGNPLAWMEADDAVEDTDVSYNHKEDSAMIRARDVQQKLLREAPQIPGYHFATRFEAAEGVSGDFYEFIELADGRIGFAQGDVSGHGMQAGLIMSMAKKVLSIYAHQFDSPKDVLAAVNDALAEDLGGKMFITITYGILDPSERTITWARAGHNPTIRLNRHSGDIFDIKPNGMVVGMKAGPLFVQACQEEITKVRSGDLFLVYTDGVTETMNRQGEEYEIRRLRELVSTHGTTCNSDELLDRILDSLRGFRGGKPHDDDITLLALNVD